MTSCEKTRLIGPLPILLQNFHIKFYLLFGNCISSLKIGHHLLMTPKKRRLTNFLLLCTLLPSVTKLGYL